MRKKRAIGLVEMMIAMTVTGFVITVALSFLISAGRNFDYTAAQLNVDQSAGAAVQWMTRDLQEAKQIDVLSPTKIKVYYPIVEANGSYNRSILDTTNTIEYYRGTSSGAESGVGAYLVRSPALGGRRTVCKNVIDLGFVSTNPSSVDITLKTRTSTYNRTAQCEMIHRAIFLRNY